MISNRDIRRQMRRSAHKKLARRIGDKAALRRWIELEREAIDRRIATTWECGCCMRGWVGDRDVNPEKEDEVMSEDDANALMAALERGEC